MKKEIDFGKRLAIGCLRLPIVENGVNALGVDDSTVDEEAFQRIVDKAMANGYACSTAKDDSAHFPCQYQIEKQCKAYPVLFYGRSAPFCFVRKRGDPM